MTTDIPILTKRKLQAEVIGPIFAEMVAELGEEKASAILERAIRKAAINEGRAFAARAPGGKPSMADFIKLFELWTTGGSLEIEVLRGDQTRTSTSMSPAAAMPKPTRTWGWKRSVICCPAIATGFCEGYDPKHEAGPEADHHGRRKVLHLPLLPGEMTAGGVPHVLPAGLPRPQLGR